MKPIIKGKAKPFMENVTHETTKTKGYVRMVGAIAIVTDVTVVIASPIVYH